MTPKIWLLCSNCFENSIWATLLDCRVKGFVLLKLCYLHTKCLFILQIEHIFKFKTSVLKSTIDITFVVGWDAWLAVDIQRAWEIKYWVHCALLLAVHRAAEHGRKWKEPQETSSFHIFSTFSYSHATSYHIISYLIYSFINKNSNCLI